MKTLPILFTILSSIYSAFAGTTYVCRTNATCGCSTSSTVLTKIVGGESAASQSWGWAASLRYSSTNSHFCGGAIISKWHILTAAHCTVDLPSPSSVRVYVGSIYLTVTAQALGVSQIFIHPSYSSSDYVNDISILKLSSPIDLDQAGVATICLPDVSSENLSNGEYPSAGTTLVAIGWGYTSEGSRTVSNTLQQVTIQAVAADSVYCKNVEIANSALQMCAGTMPQGQKDTCQGDSGGPLMMFNGNNLWEQVGITSSGYGCARANYPGVYTRVAAYQSWINATINPANLKSSSLHTVVMAIGLLLFLYRVATVC